MIKLQNYGRSKTKQKNNRKGKTPGPRVNKIGNYPLSQAKNTPKDINLQALKIKIFTFGDVFVPFGPNHPQPNGLYSMTLLI